MKNMKKILFTTIAATALIATPLAKADAAEHTTPVKTKVVYYQWDFSAKSDWYKELLQKLNIEVKDYYKNGNSSAKQDKQESVKKPVQQTTQKQPVQQNTQKPVEQTTQKQPAQQTETKTPVQNSQLSAFEQQVVDLTNQERTKAGLTPLKVDVELSRVAREKSRDMSINNYFSHTSPTYGSPFDMMKSYGISYRSAGENIAKGQRTPQEVVQAWMNSEGHRANILSNNFTHIGVGYVENGNYWTQQFIGK